ncbi:zinc ribbon domain-containing protein [Lactobacillus porci]
MKECSNCHQQIADGASFCTKCGAKQTAGKLCPRCHAEAAPTAKFCTKCGCSFAQSQAAAMQPQAGPAPASEKPSFITWLINAIVHPFEQYQAAPWYGLLILTLLIFINGWTFWSNRYEILKDLLIVNRWGFGSKLVTFLQQLNQQELDQLVSQVVKNYSLLKLIPLMTFAAALLIFVFALLLCKLGGYPQVSYTEIVNRAMHPGVYSLISVLLIAALFASMKPSASRFYAITVLAVLECLWLLVSIASAVPLSSGKSFKVKLLSALLRFVWFADIIAVCAGQVYLPFYIYSLIKELSTFISHFF